MPPTAGADRQDDRVLRWFVGLVAAAVLSAFAALLLNGQYRVEGPTLMTLWGSHGIHRGDILIAGGWLIGMIAIAMLLFEPPRN
jgi:hypothetical protein